MSVPAVIVPRAQFLIEEPWRMPPECAWTSLRRATDGGRPLLPTKFALYADRDCLNVLFQSQDDEIVATYLGHDQPLYQEDVVEIFIAPAAVTRYFEIEVNPLGTTFDARVDSPDGVRATMEVNIEWDCANLFAAVRKTPGVIETIVRFPFESIEAQPPVSGEEWHGNFFRIDRSRRHGDEFSAWQPTLKNPADFHVTAAFGRIVFA